MTSNENNNWQVNMRTLSDSAKYLFDNKEMSDVTFVFKNSKLKQEKIYAHSYILSLMSPVFYNSFKENFEVSKVISVNDKSYSVFMEFMRFIYTSECNITEDNAFDIMEVAKKYSIKFLEDDCAKFISNTESLFTVESACKTLDKIITSEHNLLKDKIINYIAPRLDPILQTNSFCLIEKQSLIVILEIEETGPITEMEIFLSTMKWAGHKCISNGIEPNGKNKRNQLGDILKLIRFPTMTSEELGQCILQEDDLLTSEEKLSLLLSASTKQRNTYGFLNQRRNQHNYWENIPNIRLNIYDENEIYDDIIINDLSLFNLTSIQRTNFNVKRTVYITGISFGVSQHPKNVTIQLLDDNRIILSRKIFESIKCEKICNKWFTFDKPILLELNREYILDINYTNTNSELFYVESKILPWHKFLNEVEFEFIELSPLLRGISFKPLK